MRFEEMFSSKVSTIADEVALMKNKMVALRKKNREQLLQRLTEPEAHRFEVVTRFRGVDFINDSGSCSTNATYYTFERIQQNVVWIAGGRDDETNYMELLGHVAEKVKALIYIGQNHHQIHHVFARYLSAIHVRNNMFDAVRSAFYTANTGDIVLLSPACECDESFENFDHRGKAFKSAIAEL
jgi:UDP-N-acetylmuramoylalanine--D-glutamate ligase